MPLTINADTDSDTRLKLLTMKYPFRVPMNKGSAHWTTSKKYRVTKEEMNQYDFVIDGKLNIYTSDSAPFITKDNTWMQNSSNLSIALAGMGDKRITLARWRVPEFREIMIHDMVSPEQIDLMAWMFAFFSTWFYIPLDHILTHAEWAKFKNYYPDRPSGYFPEHWDLEGEGSNLRQKIGYYKVEINEQLLKIGVLK